MLSMLACMAAGVACATAGPWLLRGMGWQVAHPARALRLWFTVFVAGVTAFLGSVVVGIGQAATARSGAGAVAATAAVLSGWVLLAVLGAVVGVVSHHAGPLVEGRRSGSASLLLLVARGEVQRLVIEGALVSVVEAGTPFAVAARDCETDVVISVPLVDALTAAELRSVVHHELGHLHGRHSLLRTVAMVAASVAPRAGCGASFARTVHLLTELAADDCAARFCGTDVASSALTKLAFITDDPGPFLRAQRLNQRRRQSSHSLRLSALRTRAVGR